MFEQYIARRQTAENIVTAYLTKRAKAFCTADEIAAYLTAWERLSYDDRILLKIMCNPKKKRMERIRDAERSLHLTQSVLYKQKKVALDKLGELLFE